MIHSRTRSATSDLSLVDSGPSDILATGLMSLVVFYLVMNRVIPDVMVLPIGFSLRPYEIVMALILIVWGLWMVVTPQPFPRGLVGLVGLGLMVILLIAPFIHGPGLTPYQANGAERGLMRVVLLGGLFIACYHLGTRLRYAKLLLGSVVGVTVFQALLGVWEFITEKPVTYMFDLSRSLGLVFDPNAIRDELTDVFARESGELRAATTAPHPIVFSAVVALALLVVAAWLVHSDRHRTKLWLTLSGIPLVLALPVANSRTGFVMLFAAALPFFILTIKKLPSLIPIALVMLFALGVSFIISPQTPRLLVDSVFRADQDQNTQIRLERFDRIPELLEARPIVGAGYLTHDPDIQIFDNAYNLGLIEFGILGMGVTVWWFLCCLVRAWSATRWARPDEAFITISGALAVVGLLAASLVFDAWTFDQFFPTVLVVVGAAVGLSDSILRRNDVERGLKPRLSPSM